MYPTQSSLPNSSRPAADWRSTPLLGLAAAPVVHGPMGALDETLMVLLALALLGAYGWWMRRAVRNRKDAETPEGEEERRDEPTR